MKLSQIVTGVAALVAVGSVSAQSIPSGALGPNKEFTIESANPNFQFITVDTTSLGGNVTVVATEVESAE